MICLQCNTDLEECTCPDLGDRMREASGPGRHVVCRWCRVCDQHYAVCRCERPRWMLRSGGKLYQLPAAQRALYPDSNQGVTA